MSGSSVVSAPGGQVPGTTDELASATASASAYAAAEKSDNTRRAYRSAAAQFVAYCSRVGRQPLPASAGTVADYLAHCADSGLKVSTIRLHAAAISHAHKLAGEASPLQVEAVKAVMRGVRRTLGVAPKQKAPATADLVAKMVRKLPDTLAGKRDRALILLGFAAALRRSELVSLRVEDIERTSKGVFVRLAKSKTDQEGHGSAIAVPNGSKLKPIEALDAWLAAAAIAEGSIFRRVLRGGHVGKVLTGHAVAKIVKLSARSAKLDAASFGAHSLRSGFVTSALDAGEDLLKVMDVTRHRRTDTLKIYDKRAKGFAGHAGKSFL